MSELKYVIKQAYVDPVGDPYLYYEYTRSTYLRNLKVITNTDVILVETQVDDQIWYKKELKSKLKCGKEDMQYFYDNIDNCAKYWVEIFRLCSDNKWTFEFMGYFSANNIEFDLDTCICEIDVQSSSIYDCIEKNRNLKSNYIFDNGLAGITGNVELSPSDGFLFIAADLIDIVKLTLSKMFCRGYDDQKRAYAVYPVSDFFNWQKDKDHVDGFFYSTISYLTEGQHDDGTPLTLINNYVNPTHNPYFIMIGTLSDTLNPTASNPSTKWDFTFAYIERMMREVFNVYWVLESQLYIRWEHYSWFEKEVNYNSVTATNAPMNKFKRKFKINKDDYPSSELWKFTNHSRPDWVGKPIIYPNCSNQETKNRGDENTCTDPRDIYTRCSTGEEGMNDNGFVLFDVYLSSYTLPRTGPFKVRSAVGYLTTASLENARLSVANLHLDLHRHNRPFKEGTMNGNSETFFSKVYKKEQEKIIVKDCCGDSFKPHESLVRTELGDGIIMQSEKNLSKDIITFKVKHK